MTVLDACKYDQWDNRSLSSMDIQRCKYGFCTDGTTLPGHYACICSAGYTGLNCETGESMLLYLLGRLSSFLK